MLIRLDWLHLLPLSLVTLTSSLVVVVLGVQLWHLLLLLLTAGQMFDDVLPRSFQLVAQPIQL
jgi:hypothetical protein